MIRKESTGPNAAGIDQDQELSALLEEEAAFNEIRPSLLADERYRDKYVAVLHHVVVDCDADKFQLVRRLIKKHPAEVVFVGHVQRDEAPVELPSPEITP